MLSGWRRISGLSFFAAMLTAVLVTAEPVADEVKKPAAAPSNPPVLEKQANNGDKTVVAESPGNTNSAPSSVTNAPPDSAAVITEEVRAMIHGAIEELRAYVGESSKEILERSTRNANELSQKVDETLSARLDLVERSLANNQQRHLDALRDANRSFLMQAGIFGGLGFLGVVVAAILLARAIGRFSKVALNLPGSRLPVSVTAGHAGPNASDPNAPLPAQFEQAGARFAESIERLLKRIEEWEQLMGGRFAAEQHSGNGPRALPTPAGDSENAVTRGAKKTQGGAPGATSPATANDARSEVSVLLGKGHALLNLGQAREAIICFDKAIALDPQNAGAFVKKGLAFEKLQEMERAIESYDRAINLDDSLTLAYLYKGAAYGKLQRFQEALACYEKALKAEQRVLVL
jgi:tetratricopeptide (TPR) repeat protein